LPGTRREDEILGEARDAVVNRARAEGQEQLGKARRVLESTQNAAQQEAEREGLTREGVESQLSKVQDKVGHVAGAARDAAKDEADKQGLGRTHPQGGRDPQSTR
jgi:hypothetical protein